MLISLLWRFPIICTNLPSVVDANNFVGLELADNPGKPQDRIDALIGSDFNWNMVTGDMK